MKSYPELIFVTALILVSHLGAGQSRNFVYRLKGTVNADTGTVVLLPTGGKEYDPNSTNNYKAKIKQGSFTFEGQMAYPGSFLLAFFPNYVSSRFMIEAGQQTIQCNVDSLREIPKISNKSTQEVSSVLGQKKAVLFTYTKQRPSSYVAMWELVDRMGNGYDPMFDSIYSALSPALKSTYTGKRIAQRLKSAKVTAIGQTFPTLNVVDTTNRAVSVPMVNRSKYTLVDFWFSHCGPCLSEFPKLKELYNIYQEKGFAIVGISIDKQADTDAWRKVIRDKELTWSQYLDLAGKLTINDLSIQVFPTNFLLDEHGVIIKKNVRPEELSKFLSEEI